MTLDDVILLEKQIDLLKDRSQIIFAEGTTNSGKSFIVGIAFILRIMTLDDTQTQFVLAGESVPVLERMFIHNETSFYNIFKPVCEYTRGGQGGARIVISMGKDRKDKIIYLVGYDNKKRWRSILGLTIHGFNIEEINIADDEFISEAFIRTFRNGGFMYASSNGGDPDVLVYTDYLNKGRPLDKWLSQVPKETMEELERSKQDDSYVYYFFGFMDNPTMTQKQKAALIANTPKNSYQWKTKIIGIRGIREGAIYVEYMNRAKNIIHLDMLSDDKNDMKFLHPRGIEVITIGQDVGGTDNNVFTLNVFTRNYREHIVVDFIEFNNANHDKIWNDFVEWFTPYYERYSMYMKGVFIDSAAKIMRLTMDSRLKSQFGLRCYKAYKYTIIERIDAGMTQLDQSKLLFTQKSEPCYISFTKAAYDNSSKTDVRKFAKHIHKDRVDSVEYGQAPYTSYMMRK